MLLPEEEPEGGGFSIFIHASRVNLSESNLRSLEEGISTNVDVPLKSKVEEYVTVWEKEEMGISIANATNLSNNLIFFISFDSKTNF